MSQNSTRERRATVRDVAIVVVTEPVRERRKRPRKGSRSAQVETVVTVDRGVMAAARGALRPGERMVIVSSTRVEIVRA